MRLRTRVQAPDRFDDDVEYTHHHHPPTVGITRPALPVLQKEHIIPLNPHLPPAAFPTLDNGIYTSAVKATKCEEPIASSGTMGTELHELQCAGDQPISNKDDEVAMGLAPVIDREALEASMSEVADVQTSTTEGECEVGPQGVLLISKQTY